VPLVKAVQEQQHMIEELQKGIEEREKSLRKLQDELAITSSISTRNVSDFKLEQNEPNPFTGETTIRYNLPETIQKAQLVVYNLSGKQVKLLDLSGRGDSEIKVSSELLEAGIYIYAIVSDGKVLDSKRMVVVEQ
jgi:trimeric autotransporter adhesin